MPKDRLHHHQVAAQGGPPPHSSLLLLTISVTDISWLHEQVGTAVAANTRRVPHPAGLVRQGAPRLRHHAAGQGGFGDTVKMGPGTLYGSLDRMIEAGLVARGDTQDPRRIYYRLTALGQTTLRAETDGCRAWPSSRAASWEP